MSDHPILAVYDAVLANFADQAEAHFGQPVARIWRQADPVAFASSAAGQAIQAMACVGGRPIAADVIAALGNLRAMVCLASGYEGVPMAVVRARGIVVANSAGSNAEDVADIALLLLLGAQADVVAQHRSVLEGSWRRGPGGKQRRSMIQTRVGVVGLGAIGSAVARRLVPFGCEIAWWGPREKPEAPYPRAPDLLTLARNSDALIVAGRADASNRGMIGKAVLEALGPQGILVNVSRGSIVDESALIAALQSGALGAAGLDVFETEPTPPERWKDVPNVLLSPHAGGHGLYASSRYSAMALENLERCLAGQPLLRVVA